MGVLGAVQKTSEKTSLAKQTTGKQTGQKIGNYHLWTSKRTNERRAFHP
ncbi:hypothetical protein [Fictibacillus phosphorivorans]|nr:hypothetical protein [Fictibacillus phosphorivorans]MCM3720037.1 hypothetical protein [Fictibacillus phosphorivorans]MCM3777693.1 hypothetical protein [Fictibacillus phosphorivorans]